MALRRLIAAILTGVDDLGFSHGSAISYIRKNEERAKFTEAVEQASSQAGQKGSLGDSPRAPKAIVQWVL